MKILEYPLDGALILKKKKSIEKQLRAEKTKSDNKENCRVGWQHDT